MREKVARNTQKPNKNKGFREQRIGPMLTHRKRENKPSYVRLLHRFRFIERHPSSNFMQAYGLWQRVCADSEVIKLSMALAAKKKPVHMVSVAEPFKNGARVLASLSERQLAALRQRVGVA